MSSDHSLARGGSIGRSAFASPRAQEELMRSVVGARIYSFDESPIAQVPWDETDHVRLTCDVLANPEQYLRNLRA